MAKERRRPDRGGKVSRSAAGTDTAQAADRSTRRWKALGASTTAVALDGADVARRSACSSGFRPVGRVARASEVERAFRPWPTTPRSGGVARRARHTIEGPAKDRATPALRASARRACPSLHRSSARTVKCRRPRERTSLRARQLAWESMDPLVLVRERRLSRFEGRRIFLADAVRVERPSPNEAR